VQEAYKGLVMTGRYPAAFLFLDLPVGEVDVNAHPAKAEVRFRDRGAIYGLVRGAVRARLDAADLTAKAATARKLRPDDTAPWERPASASPAAVPAAPAAERRMRPDAATPAAPAQRTTPAVHGESSAGAGDLFPAAAAGGSAAPPGTNAAPPVRALQVLGCYLVAEVSAGEVLFVDQHALHERVLYERLRAGLAAGPLASQRLLAPEPVELPPAEAVLVLEHQDALAELGLLVEGFGGGTVLLAGYPAALGRRPPAELLRAVAGYLAEHGRAPERGRLVHDLAALAACHAAVRAGDRLSGAQVEELLAQRDLVKDSHHCPHGRPAAVAFGRRDFERLFQRA
jgi:DNA mismatch repair protein MutL